MDAHAIRQRDERIRRQAFWYGVLSGFVLGAATILIGALVLMGRP